MIVHRNLEQGSLAWLNLRAGKPTASEFDSLLTPKFKVKTGAGPQSYLACKIAEAWQGSPLPTFQGHAMEQGNILEDEAKPWYSFNFNTSIDTVGFCTTDDGRIGCSPDGLIGEDSGIEIKCPAANTHVRYLMDGVVPDDYVTQVHGSMYVTGRSSWKFLSYRRGFPALVLTVMRDESIQAAIGEALAKFLAEFDAGMKRLEEINGGPPARFSAPPPKDEPMPYEPDENDIVP